MHNTNNGDLESGTGCSNRIRVRSFDKLGFEKKKPDTSGNKIPCAATHLNTYPSIKHNKIIIGHF